MPEIAVNQESAIQRQRIVEKFLADHELTYFSFCQKNNISRTVFKAFLMGGNTTTRNLKKIADGLHVNVGEIV